MEIEHPRQKKAFLGGYRHRLTGAEYHHAAVQTLPKKKPDRGVVAFSRNTQVTAGAGSNIMGFLTEHRTNNNPKF